MTRVFGGARAGGGGSGSKLPPKQYEKATSLNRYPWRATSPPGTNGLMPGVATEPSHSCTLSPSAMDAVPSEAWRIKGTGLRSATPSSSGIGPRESAGGLRAPRAGNPAVATPPAPLAANVARRMLSLSMFCNACGGPHVSTGV